MTDAANSSTGQSLHTSAASVARLRARYRTEAIFRGVGLGALLLAGAFLVVFLTTIIREGYPAFFQNYLKVEVELKQQEFDPQATRDPKVIGNANFDALVRDALYAQFPTVTERLERRALVNVLSSGAPVIARRSVLSQPDLVGRKATFSLPLDDMADLYIKGGITDVERVRGQTALTVSGVRGQVDIAATQGTFDPIREAIRVQLRDQIGKTQADIQSRQRLLVQLEGGLAAFEATVRSASGADQPEAERRLAEHRKALDAARSERETAAQKFATLQARLAGGSDMEPLDRDVSTFLLRVQGGVIKITAVGGQQARGQVILPLGGPSAAAVQDWELVRILTPENSRRIGDREIVYIESLRERGLITQSLSREFFLGGASREAEMAGVGVAVVGSLITLLITLGLSFPIGVAAAIYLEEFAPKNRWTELIEVNINNLAAVPSIIFGLLGLAIFLNVFDMPRSAPVVGGMVLALMTLPIIIIASRAAIRAVPPSIKEAALGVGASHQQAVFHHVLPLAMPGILTGTILGMAHALGETAPLLMIGMVAFVVDYPKGFSDAATLLPVQIFMWADFPERAFQQKTAAAILVLLVFLVCMNLLAIILRKRFERRW